jgi:hypothetical protein
MKIIYDEDLNIYIYNDDDDDDYSHPCVLWLASQDSIGTLDIRTKGAAVFHTEPWLYNLEGASTIVDLQRHPRYDVMCKHASIDISDRPLIDISIDIYI